MIREVNIKDIDVINKLGKLITSNYVNNINFDSTTQKTYVYDIDNLVVAFISLNIFPDEIEVIDIVVDIKYQNKGIGSKLLNYVVNKYNKNILLEVKTTNEPAINLYKKFGFKTISIRKNYYKDTNTDAYIMIREE